MFSTSRTIRCDPFLKSSWFCTHRSVSNPQVNNFFSPSINAVPLCKQSDRYLCGTANSNSKPTARGVARVQADGENESDRSLRDRRLRALSSQAITAILSRNTVLPLLLLSLPRPCVPLILPATGAFKSCDQAEDV